MIKYIKQTIKNNKTKLINDKKNNISIKQKNFDELKQIYQKKPVSINMDYSLDFLSMQIRDLKKELVKLEKTNPIILYIKSKKLTNGYKYLNHN